jgi:NAD(P)-dependent dehydrogenase (short-subunit alcohol dehydrogenase family)
MNGKLCVVTGANTGIGRATAEDLARRGAHVVMVCRNRERAEQARAEIERATGSSALEVVIADLSLMSDVRRAAGEIAAKHPRIDVLVNNAAVFLPAREETAEGLEKTFAWNYLSL